MVKYKGVYLEKAVFDFEFEDRKEEFEIISNLKENNSIGDKIKEPQNYEYFGNLINASSNLYNSSDFYYLNETFKNENKDSKNQFLEVKLVFSIIILAIILIVILR